jgi:hypothetical protein
VLLFEFFPAFMALVSLVVGGWLYVANRRAAQDPREKGIRRIPPPRTPGTAEEERGSRRPSMSA